MNFDYEAVDVRMLQAIVIGYFVDVIPETKTQLGEAIFRSLAFINVPECWYDNKFPNTEYVNESIAHDKQLKISRQLIADAIAVKKILQKTHADKKLYFLTHIEELDTESLTLKGGDDCPFYSEMFESHCDFFTDKKGNLRSIELSKIMKKHKITEVFNG